MNTIKLELNFEQLNSVMGCLQVQGGMIANVTQAIQIQIAEQIPKRDDVQQSTGSKNNPTE